MISRASLFLLDLLLFCIGWYLCYNVYRIQDPKFYTLLLSLPGTVLIYFGCYSLFTIGKGLYILQDCPEEYESLMVDVKRANHVLPQMYAEKGLSVNQ